MCPELSFVLCYILFVFWYFVSIKGKQWGYYIIPNTSSTRLNSTCMSKQYNLFQHTFLANTIQPYLNIWTEKRKTRLYKKHQYKLEKYTSSPTKLNWYGLTCLKALCLKLASVWVDCVIVSRLLFTFVPLYRRALLLTHHSLFWYIQIVCST